MSQLTFKNAFISPSFQGKIKVIQIDPATHRIIGEHDVPSDTEQNSINIDFHIPAIFQFVPPTLQDTSNSEDSKLVLTSEQNYKYTLKKSKNNTWKLTIDKANGGTIKGDETTTVEIGEPQ